MTPTLASYVDERLAESSEIERDRRRSLEELGEYVSRGVRRGDPVELTFICTHNSRRSHLSQLWAAVAADHFGISGVETYSGGTEATAFNPRAVAAIKRAGFLVDSSKPTENPTYLVRIRDDGAAMTCFSKVYDAPPNPTEGYGAVMTCSDADRNCPTVAGAAARFAIPYDDPKASDGTALEAATYDERCRQIARELLYAFSHAADALAANATAPAPRSSN